MEYVKRVVKILKSPEFLRFFIVGFSAFALDAALLAFQIKILNFDPFFHVELGPIILNISIANAISTLIALIYGFVLQKFWAFKSEKRIYSQAILYSVAAAFNYSLSNVLYGFAVKDLMITALVAKFIVSGIMMVWSYFVYKYLVFNQKA